MITNSISDAPIVSQDIVPVTNFRAPQNSGERRRTPRKCLIVVLAENHVVSSEQVTARLPRGESEEVNVILACAGQSRIISELQRKIRDLQILLAPAGTSAEDLRELAMGQAPGDIVTLLSGTPAVCDASENAGDQVIVAI